MHLRYKETKVAVPWSNHECACCSCFTYWLIKLLSKLCYLFLWYSVIVSAYNVVRSIPIGDEFIICIYTTGHKSPTTLQNINELNFFSHTYDFPPCREQLWDKSISHGFHDLQLCAVYLAWLTCLGSAKYARKCILCDFPCDFTSDPGGIRRLVVRKIHLAWKTIQNAYHTTSKM